MSGWGETVTDVEQYAYGARMWAECALDFRGEDGLEYSARACEAAAEECLRKLERSLIEDLNRE